MQKGPCRAHSPNNRKWHPLGKEDPVTPICLVNATGSSAPGATAPYRPPDVECRGRDRRAILGVDDDPVVLCLLRLLLVAGFDAITAGNSTVAMHAFAVRLPDAVFPDYSLPDASGVLLAVHGGRSQRRTR